MLNRGVAIAFIMAVAVLVGVLPAYRSDHNIAAEQVDGSSLSGRPA